MVNYKPTFFSQVWVSYAHFERGTEEDDAMVKARGVYRRANNMLKSSEEKEERLMLLESWQQFEVSVVSLKIEELLFGVAFCLQSHKRLRKFYGSTETVCRPIYVCVSHCLS